MGRPSSRQRRETEIGIEVQCARCKDFWPEDEEFYFLQDGRAHSWCKACYRGDHKVLAKVERWKARQRKHAAAPQAAPAVQWAPLFDVISAMCTHRAG